MKKMWSYSSVFSVLLAAGVLCGPVVSYADPMGPGMGPGMGSGIKAESYGNNVVQNSNNVVQNSNNVVQNSNNVVQNSLESVTATVSDSGGSLFIKFKGIVETPKYFFMETPNRMIVDFQDTASDIGQEIVNNKLISSISFGNIGSGVRMVVTLKEKVTAELDAVGNKVTMKLKATAINLGQNASESLASSDSLKGMSSLAPNADVHKKDTVKRSEISLLTFARMADGGGKIKIKLSDKNVAVAVVRENKQLVIHLKNSTLSRNLKKVSTVSDYGTPVQTIKAMEVSGGDSEIILGMEGSYEHIISQLDDMVFIDVKPVTSLSNKKIGAEGGFVGDKLTLNFQSIPVSEALNVIADFTGLNVIVSDTVTGTLTMRLKDVPWDQALDIMLKSKGLDVRKVGNVLQIAPREELEAREKADLQSKQDLSDLESINTEAFALSYQKGDDVVELLVNDKQRLLSKRGSAVVDKRTNTLFVQDSPSKIEQVRALLKRIDVPVRQVMIEARVVSAVDNFGRDLGVKLGVNGKAGITPVGAAGAPNGGLTSPFNFIGNTNGTISGSNVNFPSAALQGGTLLLTLFNSAATKFLSLELSAMETDGSGKVMSSPRVITADQTEATIEQGQEIPYQQATSSGATNVSFKKATLSLKVTPQITPDNKVNMKVSVNKDSVNATAVNGVPIIDTNKVETTVLVDNGGTVVLGGVYSTSDLNTVNKVPLLGDIPVLGNLFKSSSKATKRSELMIFITPRIIREASEK